jgi:hypothetical protein
MARVTTLKKSTLKEVTTSTAVTTVTTTVSRQRNSKKPLFKRTLMDLLVSLLVPFVRMNASE